MESRMPGSVRTVYELNPLVGIFELHHAAWLGSSGPPRTGLIVAAAVGSLLCLLIGWVVFRRLEPAVLKEL
jgi:ABC-2 type transport system permease protein